MDASYPEVLAALDVLLQKMRQGGTQDTHIQDTHTRDIGADPAAGTGTGTGTDGTSTSTSTSADTDTAMHMGGMGSDEYSVKDIGYCLSGISGMPRFLHTEVDGLLEELNVKVAKSKLKGNSELTFLQDGKRIKVRIGGKLPKQRQY
jgi:hypothetical protein